MARRVTGIYRRCTTGDEAYDAFVPSPLPPVPPLDLTADHYEGIDRANLALGRLDALGALLPDVSLMLYFFVRKEALLSSQIEGTQSSFTDLLLHEENAPTSVPSFDVAEVSTYVAALEHGLRRLNELPLSVRLIREMHQILLSQGRGEQKSPGELRRGQVWIGGVRPSKALFVPPPWEEVEECLAQLEKFLHNMPSKTPLLLKAAMAHVQFETIHPFLDGNGRVGRLLITLLLCSEGALKHPLLYLSLYFKRHRELYYHWLQRIRTDGDWEGWITFFLEGVETTATEAMDSARRIIETTRLDAMKVASLRGADLATRAYAHLCRHPITAIQGLSDFLGVSVPTATKVLGQFTKLGLVEEITGGRRNRMFSYKAYLEILSEGAAPIRTA